MTWGRNALGLFIVQVCGCDTLLKKTAMIFSLKPKGNFFERFGGTFLLLVLFAEEIKKNWFKEPINKTLDKAENSLARIESNVMRRPNKASEYLKKVDGIRTELLFLENSFDKSRMTEHEKKWLERLITHAENLKKRYSK